jgi:uncharacterized protein YjbI with pentapeptide repeats
MSPQVVAAIIAASVSVLTLIGTLAAQYFGRRATSRDTEKTLGEQGKHLDRTLAEQREQLDRTLAEQREQLDRTLAEQRTRTLNERFATAADQLGSDKPAVRLAGVYAMAGLADDWEENRQTCVDVLCAYLRMPYEPDPSQDASEPQRLAFQAIREVRHTVIRVITAHLKKDATVSWQGLNFDFTNVHFDGGSFAGSVFSGGIVNFHGAEFLTGEISFRDAVFSGADVSFRGAVFSGATVGFTNTNFSGGYVVFRSAVFDSGTISFTNAAFSGARIRFSDAIFSGGTVGFAGTAFSGSDVSFRGAAFRGATVGFVGATFSGGNVDYSLAKFSDGVVDFSLANFSGGAVNFREPRDWSHPPTFGFNESPPPEVKFSATAMGSRQ